MTSQRLFTELSELIPAGIEREYPDYPSACILATRIAIEVAEYFGIQARPLACRVVLYNAAFARHLDAGEEPDIERWHREDGSHSVGIGCGAPARPNAWDGHLIAVTGDTFADFSIQQAERLERGIVTGPALIGPYREGLNAWRAVNGRGTVIEYAASGNLEYRSAPDWKEPGRRRRISGPIIRELRKRMNTDNRTNETLNWTQGEPA